MDAIQVTLVVELWFESEPQLDAEALLAAVPGADLLPDEEGEVAHLAHPRFVHEYEGGERSCPQTVIFPPGPDVDKALVPTFEQTWDWPEAGDVMARCTHSLTVMEIYGRVHAHDERIACFLPTLRALIEQTRPTAAYVPNATRVVRPSELLEDEIAPFANVRFFRVEDDDRLVMDTLGLHVFRLPDAQCIYRSAEHEPNDIGAMLHDLAGYLLDRGDVIEDGDTVGEEPWRCRHEVSALGPERRVLNLTADRAT